MSRYHGNRLSLIAAWIPDSSTQVVLTCTKGQGMGGSSTSSWSRCTVWVVAPPTAALKSFLLSTQKSVKYWMNLCCWTGVRLGKHLLSAPFRRARNLFKSSSGQEQNITFQTDPTKKQVTWNNTTSCLLFLQATKGTNHSQMTRSPFYFKAGLKDLVIVELWSALTLQLWVDVSGQHGRLGHVGRAEARVDSQHGGVVHKLLMKGLPLVIELGPQEVTAEPVYASIPLETQSIDIKAHPPHCFQLKFKNLHRFY